jgi:hypothetical protein
MPCGPNERLPLRSCRIAPKDLAEDDPRVTTEGVC